VEERGLEIKRKRISVDIETELNTKVCRSWSWLIRLERILLIKKL